MYFFITIDYTTSFTKQLYHRETIVKGMNVTLMPTVPQLQQATDVLATLAMRAAASFVCVSISDTDL